MAALYSRQLLAVHAGAAGTITAPAGSIIVVRDIAAFNPNAILPETAALVHHPSGATVYQASNLFSASPTNGGYDHLECRIVLNPGETLTTNNGGDIDMFVSGYELRAP